MSYLGGDMNISSISNLASNVTETSKPVDPPTQDQKALIQAVKAVNAAELFGQENELTFIIDRAAKIAVVRIVNKKTGEVVEQIPNQQVLKMAEESYGR
jgi:flagellar protein FlaG